jgi:hypothetical protein
VTKTRPLLEASEPLGTGSRVSQLLARRLRQALGGDLHGDVLGRFAVGLGSGHGFAPLVPDCRRSATSTLSTHHQVRSVLTLLVAAW